MLSNSTKQMRSNHTSPIPMPPLITLSRTCSSTSPGDLVLIRRQPVADPGQIVAALIENEATLKIFLPDPKRRKIVLRAANDDKAAYPDRIYDAILIRGVAVRVLKPL